MARQGIVKSQVNLLFGCSSLDFPGIEPSNTWPRWGTNPSRRRAKALGIPGDHNPPRPESYVA
eukprot:491706-Amorphochlora_amoeboformis.AAC.1